MEKVIAFLKSKAVETFLWQTLNGIIGLVVVYLSGENIAYAAVLIPLLNICTKYINTNYIK